MIAYHNNPSLKAAILRQLEMHREYDEIVKGQFWENGKGCAVGCTIHSGNFIEYEARFGIPVMLAHLEDSIFEGLPNHLAMEWPGRFMSAIAPGADLSKVGWLFLYWLLTAETANPGINHPLVRDAVATSADIMRRWADGEMVTQVETKAADKSAWAAKKAALSAAEAEAAWAAWAASSAAEAEAEGEWVGAEAAAAAAEAAWAGAAEAEWSGAAEAEGEWVGEGVWVLYADKLVSLIAAAPRQAD